MGAIMMRLMLWSWLVLLTWNSRAVAAPFAYITNSGDGTVSVVDTATNTVAGTITVGRSPTGVAVNPAGTRAYVSNLDDGTLSVIDTASRSVVTTIAVGSLPVGVAVDPTGQRVYVSNFSSSVVSIVDATANALLTSIPVGNSPSGIVVSPNGALIYVANAFSGSVSVVDAVSHNVDTIAVGGAPEGLALNSSGSLLYVTNNLTDEVSVVDTVSRTMIDSVPVASFPTSLALNPTGTRLYVLSTGGAVSIIDTTDRRVVASVPVPDGSPSPLSFVGLSVYPSGTKLYVASPATNAISIIDTAQNAVTGSIDVGRGPAGFGQFIGPCAAAADCDDASICTTDTCDLATGRCQYVPVNEGSLCDDHSACTSADRCVSGVCSGTATDCSDPNPCTDDSCDPTTGACVHTNNTLPCNDGSACTDHDTCQQGSCAGQPIGCDDPNVCTDDSCDPASGCVHVNNTSPCSDGNACTDGDACRGGTCVSGSTLTCDDGNPCTDDSCDAVNGCVHVNNTRPCNDGNLCTASDTCQGGVCVGSGSLACDDGNPCTDDSCPGPTGCLHVNNTAACNDGNACTVNDVCQGGTCVGGPARNCDDGNPCTADGCNATAGCFHTNQSGACSDGNACTSGDTCQGGQCVGQTTINCDDGNPCTDDTCSAANGCQHTNNAASCSDGNLCTVGDVCQSGHCVPGGPLNCNDNNSCTDDICDSTIGCLHANNSSPCSDANSCTTGDVCNGGVCVGGNTATGCTACQAVATIPGQGGIFIGATNGTSSLTGPCADTTSPERVYGWTPTASGVAVIKTCSTTVTNYDTVLYLRQGNCQTGTTVACNDDTDGCGVSDGLANWDRHGSRITPTVTAGQTYYIVVDGYAGRHGNYSLTVDPPGVCGNNVREGLEQCDGTDVSGCVSGQCTAGCQCVPPASGLPDLVPAISDVSIQFGATVSSGDVAEGCAESTSGIDLLRFTAQSQNQGTADFYLGDPLCPSPCTDHPLEVCGNPDFICSPAAGHNHAHYNNYARYDLLDASGQSLVVGHKQGFCLRDTACNNPQYTCTNQGITAGCSDTYGSTLGCQYLDITDVPAGNYTLRVVMDPFGRVPELNEGNNIATAPVTISRGTSTTTTTLPPTACSSPVLVPATGGTFAGTTTGANSLTGSCGASGTAPERVYQWTPAASGTATIQTCSTTATTYDTVVYVRQGTCGSGSEVGCNDDTTGCGTTTDVSNPHRGSRLTPTVTAGQTYFIVVDGYSGSSGNFSLTITPPGVATTTTTSTLAGTTTTSTTLPGGACAAPVIVPPTGGAFDGTTSGASSLTGSCGTSDASPERVYQWTPSASGTATIETCSTTATTYDTVVYVRQGTCGSGTELGCNDDTTGCGTTTDVSNPHRGSRVTPAVTAGQTYFIVVDGYNGGSGNFHLSVTPPGASTSTTTTTTTTTNTTTTTVSACTNPTLLPSEGGTFTGSTSGPSTLAGSCGTSGVSPERVFRWTAPRTGTATLRTCGTSTNYDTVLYVRQGTCTGSEVACNDDTPGCAVADGSTYHGSTVTISAVTGTNYFIVVDGYNGRSGTFGLTVIPPP